MSFIWIIFINKLFRDVTLFRYVNQNNEHTEEFFVSESRNPYILDEFVRIGIENMIIDV